MFEADNRLAGPAGARPGPGPARDGAKARPLHAGSTGAHGGASARNRLLRALPSAVLERIGHRFERVRLKPRQILHERNLPIAHAYFIESGLASLLSRSEDGARWVEVGTLGRDDLSGVCLALGGAASSHRCVVQVGGEALRIEAADLEIALEGEADLRRVVLRYVQALMAHCAQVGVCNARHNLRQRLARWLLVAHDRLDGNEIPVTHNVLGRIIGVRRAGVTTAMGRMESAGLLYRGRGRLVIADRAGLEGEACECYRALRSDQRRIVCDAA